MNSDLFKKKTVKQFLNHYRTLLRGEMSLNKIRHLQHLIKALTGCTVIWSRINVCRCSDTVIKTHQGFFSLSKSQESRGCLHPGRPQHPITKSFPSMITVNENVRFSLANSLSHLLIECHPKLSEIDLYSCSLSWIRSRALSDQILFSWRDKQVRYW